MALHLLTGGNRNLFTGHGEGYVAINDKRFEHAVVVMAGAVRTDWTATDFASLEAAQQGPAAAVPAGARTA